MRSRISVVILSIVIFTTFTAFTFGQKKTGSDLKQAVERVDDATEAMSEIIGMKDRSIPRDLLKKAKAVVVFPGVLKGAFIVGGQGGKGVAVRRVGNGWSAPAFLNMAGGSIGLQIGGSKTDYVLLVMNDKGLKNLLADKFEIGGEGSAAAGPVGRTAAASTNVTLDAEILTYSRSKGLFAGVSLKGVVISSDQDLNTAIYEKTAKQILGEPPVLASAAPGSLQKFGTAVAAMAK